MIKNYLKIAFRHLLRQSGISFLNVLGFSLGIACSFLGIVYALGEYSYDKHFTDHERIYRISVDFMGMGGFAVAPEVLSSYLHDNCPEVENITSFKNRGQITLKENERAIKADLVATDSQFFQVFDYSFLQGQPTEVLKAPYEAVLSESLAKNWFGDENPIGKTLSVVQNHPAFKIVGVVKDPMQNTHLKGNLWISNFHWQENKSSWFSASCYTYTKLKKGAGQSNLQATLNEIIEKEVYPQYGQSSGVPFEKWIKQEKTFRFFVYPLTDIYLHSKLNFELKGGGDETKVLGFLLIGLFILFIALANYINLTTAQFTVRAKEIAIKKAVGANKQNLIQQFLIEAVVFGLLAALGALILAEIVQIGFEQFTGAPLISNPIFHPVTVAGFVGFSVLSSFVAGIYPALWLSRFLPIQMIRGQQSFGMNNWVRSGLVVLQFTIALGLIIGSIVLYQQLQFMQEKDLGFKKEGLLVISNINTLEEKGKVFQKELENLPIVASTSIAQSVPASNSIYQTSFKTPEMEQSVPMRTFPVDAGFIPTFGMTLLEGRNFRPNSLADSISVIINESAAKALGLTQALGAEIREGVRVIGVVSDFHIESFRHGIQPVVLTHATSGSELALRLSRQANGQEVQDFLQNVTEKWNIFAPNSAFQYAFIDDSFARFAEQEALQSKGILALTFLAIFIACLGLFALATFSTRRRTKEIGIRKVLGASVENIVKLLTKDFIKLVLIALLIASPLAWWTMNDWLQSFAYRIDIQWWVFVLAGTGAIAIAFLTVSFQSVKAALANPVNSLRSE